MCREYNWSSLSLPFFSSVSASKVLSEGGSFFKGMLMGGIFCLVLSLLASFSPISIFGTEEHHHQHQHHHVQAPSKDELKSISDADMQQLNEELRVYCVIMVQPKALVYWAAALDTWSKHCDKAVFYTSENSKALDAVDLNEKDDWARLRKALKHAYKHAGNLRWFFVAQPTTFAIIENLKYLLLTKDPNDPFYMGNLMKSGELEYVSFDSGIVLSYEALRRLVNTFEDEAKCPERGRALWKLSDDKQLAACLKYTGVFAENGEDANGKGLFNSQSVYRMITDSMKDNPNNVVEGCCSDMAVTYSGMTPNQMQVMMFGVYRLRPYGHDFHDVLAFYPPKDSDND